MKKNNSPTNSQSINNIELNLTKTPINFENLKNDEKYFGEKEKDKKKNNDLNSIDFSNLNKSSSSLLDDEALSRINTYSPQFIRYMNKDPYLLPLDYSSIYKAQVQGKMNIDINLESINNFFKHLQDLNDKMIRICNINPNINSLFNNNNYNYNQIYQCNKYNVSDYNKLGEDVYTCYFLLKILVDDNLFHNKNIKINFDNFIKDNMNIFFRKLIMDKKVIDIEIFLKLKILHMGNFINFMSKNFERQKDAVEEILSKDPTDFYGLYSLAYIRFIQSKIPESSELITSLMNRKEIVDVPLYYSSLIFMKSLIDKNS